MRRWLENLRMKLTKRSAIGRMYMFHAFLQALDLIGSKHVCVNIPPHLDDLLVRTQVSGACCLEGWWATDNIKK